MYNVFQQPWLLLLVAFVLLVVVYIIRSSFPDKQRWWHLLIPVLIAVGAVAPTPLRVKEAEAMLEGQKPQANLLRKVAVQAAEGIKPPLPAE